MARHLDLEEQEQLDELKHFWNQYGNPITWFLIVVLGAYAAWNGWNYWQRQQAFKASALFEVVETAAAAGDTAKVQQAFNDIRGNYGRTTFAQQAALMAAKALQDKGQPDAAKAALQWLVDEGHDEGYQAVARLRLAALLAQNKAYDDALRQLSASMPSQFQAIAADRRGDVYKLQGKQDQAKAEYTKAWQGLGNDLQYRSLVEVKLTALGVDVQALKPAESAQS